MRTALPLLGAAFVLALTASSVQADKIDDYVRAEIARQKIPGASIAVVRHGKIVKEAGYGFANVEHRVPARPETIYQSGSVGKQFTAALTLLLAADGKFALDDPIGKHLPGTPESWKGVTIRHLLTHTSGLGDPYEKLDFRKDYTEAELLAIDGALPLLFAPGERWSYSNMGYHVLGFLCSKVGGKFYAEQLAERIFKPIGMTTARLINEAEIVPNRAAGYEIVGGKLQNQSWVSPTLNTTADGSLYVTVRDMARWDAALYTDTPLTRAQRDAMWTPVRLNSGATQPYGFGWQLGEVNGHKRIEHSGAWQGFTTQISRFVDDGLTVIVLTNRAGSRPGTIANGIAALYVPVLKPVPPPAIVDSEPKVTARLRKTLETMAAGTLVTDDFTPEFRSALTPERLNGIRETMQDFGALKSVALLSRKDEGEQRVYTYRAVYERETLVVRYTLTRDDKVAGLGLRPEE